MSIIEKATAYMEQLAAESGHGYDQTYRWGEYGDYDCSSAVITAWEHAGVPVKTGGATYTGNMRGVFLRSGFADVTASINLSTGAGLQRGDVLLNYERHTAMYVGSGKEVEASINEFGTAKGGRPGDQTGREFYVRDYRNYPWNCVLRYIEDGNNSLPLPEIFWPPRELTIGVVGGDVCALQGLLNAHGYYLDCDGDFGNLTRTATMAFQVEHGLVGDGIAGPLTWDKLLARG